MQIKIETSPYNSRRYGKPWIAKVDFSTAKGDFAFGEWVGSPGEAGLLLINAEPGDILANGQKDHRARRPEPPYFKEVNTDGTLTNCPAK